MRALSRWMGMTLCAVVLGGCGAPEEATAGQHPGVVEIEDPGSEQAKQDWFGNATEGEPCDRDWHCSADLGLVCRPVVDDEGPKFRCARPALAEGTCYESDDCLEGLECQGAQYIPSETHLGYVGETCTKYDEFGNPYYQLCWSWQIVVDRPARKVVGACR